MIYIQLFLVFLFRSLRCFFIFFFAVVFVTFNKRYFHAFLPDQFFVVCILSHFITIIVIFFTSVILTIILSVTKVLIMIIITISNIIFRFTVVLGFYWWPPLFDCVWLLQTRDVVDLADATSMIGFCDVMLMQPWINIMKYPLGISTSHLFIPRMKVHDSWCIFHCF